MAHTPGCCNLDSRNHREANLAQRPQETARDWARQELDEHQMAAQSLDMAFGSHWTVLITFEGKARFLKTCTDSREALHVARSVRLKILPQIKYENQIERRDFL